MTSAQLLQPELADVSLLPLVAPSDTQRHAGLLFFQCAKVNFKMIRCTSVCISRKVKPWQWNAIFLEREEKRNGSYSFLKLFKPSVSLHVTRISAMMLSVRLFPWFLSEMGKSVKNQVLVSPSPPWAQSKSSPSPKVKSEV